MKNINNFLNLIPGLGEKFEQNPERTYKILELVKEGKDEELKLFLETKFFFGTKLIDDGIVITPYAGPEKTNKELLDKYISIAREKGFTFYYNNATTGYDSDIDNWKVLEEKVTESPKEIYLPILPKGSMTQKEMFEQAKLSGKNHLHSVSTAIRLEIALMQKDFFTPGQENGSWVPVFLDSFKKDGVPCRLSFGLGSDGRLRVNVIEVREQGLWFSPRVGLPLSNKLSEA